MHPRFWKRGDGNEAKVTSVCACLLNANWHCCSVCRSYYVPPKKKKEEIMPSFRDGQRHARVYPCFSTEENLVSFLCCSLAKVLPSHFTESKDVPSVPVHFVCLFLEFPCSSLCPCVPRAYGDFVPSTNLRGCSISMLDISFEDAAAACLTPLSWCSAEGAVLKPCDEASRKVRGGHLQGGRVLQAVP